MKGKYLDFIQKDWLNLLIETSLIENPFIVSDKRSP